jgi:hypothetical protein
MSFKILMAALVIVTVLTAAGITILARRAEALEVHIIDFDPAANRTR